MAEQNDMSFLHEGARKKRETLGFPPLPVDLLEGKISGDKITKIREADAACAAAMIADTANFAQAREALTEAANAFNSARISDLHDPAVVEFSAALERALAAVRKVEQNASSAK